MKLDLLLIPVGARYAEMRAAAVAAEEAGWDGVWTWDHLRDPDEAAEAGVPESWTTLTALAEATRRVTIGPLVLNTGLRHPGLLANMAATLQQVSGGRLLLGIGAGATPSMAYAREQTALGLEVAGDRVRAERVAETAQVLRRLWSGEASSFAGRQFRLDRPSGFLRPDPPPPIIVGGFGPRMAAIAGRFGDGFNTQAMTRIWPSWAGWRARRTPRRGGIRRASGSACSPGSGPGGCARTRPSVCGSSGWEWTG